MYLEIINLTLYWSIVWLVVASVVAETMDTYASFFDSTKAYLCNRGQYDTLSREISKQQEVKY